MWSLLVLLIALLTGCASTAGSAKTLAAVPPDAKLTQYTKLALTSAAGGDATPMSEMDRDRIVRLVLSKLQQRAPARFTDLAPASTDGETLKVTIAFTRYDEGNAFARFMLAGLGQIHINADVTLEDGFRGAPLGRYEVTKTFAWGGIYGASTGIRDVEEGFADAVVNVVLGQPD